MILVTGATGFVGNHVARQLIARGERVRILIRSTSNLKWLSDLKLETTVGDLRDKKSLETAVKGCTQLYHVAADYRFDVSNQEDTYKSNVEGTRNLLEAAGHAGLKRIVYTSTVGCIGFIDGGLADENSPCGIEHMVGTYKRTKFQAEQEVLKLAKAGLPVVIVNPTAPIGEFDSKPTPTGEMIVRFLQRKMPAVIDTGLNLIDVRDCALGHILAAEKGRIGERYILGCKNMTLMEIAEAMGRAAGLPPPRFHMPYAVAYMAAWFDTKVAPKFGKTTTISLEGVKMAKKKMWVDGKKAVQELGLPQTPPQEALARAIAWYRQHGYAPAVAPKPVLVGAPAAAVKRELATSDSSRETRP